MASKGSPDGCFSSGSSWDAWCLNALGGIYSLKAVREGPKLLLKVALGVILLMIVTFSWSLSRRPGSTLGLGEKKTDGSGSVAGGLRMVVFGGGDVATPGLSSSKTSDKVSAWTEVMCQNLGCDTYLSFIPKTDGMGGAVISNTLLDAAHKHITTVSTNGSDNTTGLDYSWIVKQYPRTARHDLAAQINSFLSSPRKQRASPETLWVFQVGFWDIWYLAALPRRLATEVLDSTVRDLFFNIERLYQAAQDRESTAFSNYYAELGASTALGPKQMAEAHRREPFRIFLAQLFDITLTPGFERMRPDPPSPHSRSDQLRNAAFLAKYWDGLLELAVDDWLATPDPENWSAADTIDIGVVKALAGKRLMAIGEKRGRGQGKELGDHTRSSRFLLPRRKVASYAISRYLRELMIDRQLRNADLSDRNGLGARLPEDGFLYITTPCVSGSVGNGPVEDGETVGLERKVYVCEEPDNHLFYTEYTVGQRAIREIGVRAARSFLDQVEVTSRWRGEANDRETGRERKGYKAAKIKG